MAIKSKCAFKFQDAALYELFAGVLFCARRRRLVRRQAVLQDHRSGEVPGQARYRLTWYFHDLALLSCTFDTEIHDTASHHSWVAGVTLNRSLYETVLRELLLERAEHTVELYEGSGAAWRKVR